MSDNCNLCFKNLNGLFFDLRNCKSQQSGMYLISLIENVLGNRDCLQNVIIVCKECNDLLLELDVLKFRLLEIENIMKQYIEKGQQFNIFPESNHTNENENEQLSSGQHEQMQEFELFEDIIDNEHVKDEDTEEIFCYDSSQLVDQISFIPKNGNEKTIQKNISKEPNSQYACHCSKMFHTSNQLKKHIRSHNERPYVCELCGQPYKQKTGFNTHMKMHEGLSPFTCVYCNKSFTQKIALIRHVPMHTGEKPYQCEECGKRFTHHTSFSAHKLIHTGKKPFQCLNCSQSFRSSSHLTRHKRVHTGEKKYGCAICGKHFAERYNLVVHQKIHSNENSDLSTKGKHCCQICGERFERPAKLEDHKVKKHLSVKMEPLPPMHSV